jgi:hypothetical protein
MLRRHVDAAGLAQAAALVLAVTLFAAAVTFGSVSYGFLAVLLLASVLATHRRYRGNEQRDVARLRESLPPEFRRRLVSRSYELAGLVLAVVGAFSGHLLLGSWGGPIGAAAALAPWILEIWRRYRAQRERAARLVLAGASSMTADELALLINGLNDRYHGTFAASLRDRL